MRMANPRLARFTSEAEAGGSSPGLFHSTSALGEDGRLPTPIDAAGRRLNDGSALPRMADWSKMKLELGAICRMPVHEPTHDRVQRDTRRLIERVDEGTGDEA
jgi:hypothetical protein